MKLDRLHRPGNWLRGRDNNDPMARTEANSTIATAEAAGASFSPCWLSLSELDRKGDGVYAIISLRDTLRMLEHIKCYFVQNKGCWHPCANGLLQITSVGADSSNPDTSQWPPKV